MAERVSAALVSLCVVFVWLPLAMWAEPRRCERGGEGSCAERQEQREAGQRGESESRLHSDAALPADNRGTTTRTERSTREPERGDHE